MSEKDSVPRLAGLFILLLLALYAIISPIFKDRQECHSRGGVYVAGAIGYECAKGIDP